MKKCTHCGKEYADEATVCEVDARPLVEALTKSELRSIAVGQRLLVVAFVIAWALACVAGFTSSLADSPFMLLFYASLIFWAVVAYRYARALRLPNPWTRTWNTMIPVIGLFVMIWLIRKGTKELRSAGVSFGLLGTRLKDSA